MPARDRAGPMDDVVRKVGQQRKLTDGQATEARRRWDSGETMTALADEYGIRRSSMSKILAGITYTAPWKPNKPKVVKVNKRRLTADQVYGARVRARMGEQITVLAAEYGLNHSGMSKIVRGIHYKNVGGPISAAKPKETVGNVAAFTMRMERARTNAPRKVLARKYGCSESTVSLILTGKRYKDAGGPIWERLT